MFIARDNKQRRLHKAYLRYHDPKNWDDIRSSLQEMGRSDLIGDGTQHLVPTNNTQGRKNSKGKSKEGFNKARGGQWDNRKPNKKRR